MQKINTQNPESDVGEALMSQASGGNEQSKEALEIAEEARGKYVHPSFCAKMFMGKFDPYLLFPFPEQSDEDKKIGDEYIQKISAFLVGNLDPDEVDVTRTIPDEVIKGLAELGAFALKVPKEYGGLGFSQTNYNRVIMHVGSYCGSTAVLLSAHQSIGVPQPLKMYGTEEQKKKYYPRFREGWISAFALTEPDVGSDPAQMKTEARLSEDGSHYILNGTKLWCTNGVLAKVIVVMARTAPKMINGKEKKQISAFILEMDTPGIELIHRCEFMGLGGIYNAYLRFTDVKIPKENLLDREGRGLAIALGTINVGRLTLPAACAAAAKQCLTICRRWGNKRIQWGQPVGLHEAGREKIAHMSSMIFAMDAVSMLCSSWQDQGNVDIRIEAAMAKMFCTEVLWKITDETMQLRGGRGFEKAQSLRARGEPPYPVERIMRDCRVNMILEGSTEIMKLFLAREAMDPHLSKAADILFNKTSFWEKVKTGFSLLGFYLKWYPRQWWQSLFGPSYPQFGPLARHFKYIDRMSHKLAKTVFYYMAKYRQGLEQRQMTLGRLMEIGTDLFVMAATCSYANSLVRKKPDDKIPEELADFFCRQARRRIKSNWESLADNDDRKANQLAKKIMDGKALWLEEGVIPIPEEE